MTMPRKPSSERGFGVIELMMVLLVIAVITVIGTPNLLRYWQWARLNAGADELAGILAQARGLAIRENRTYCVERTGNSLRFRAPTCADTIWTGIGTDGNGAFSLSNNMQVTAADALTFTGIGGATAQATFTVRNPTTNTTRVVTVTTTGRVTW
jgi:prepilin-type N-terminal cleavage/methylation domain-containing protein